MARINVEQKALTDGRYVELGRLIGGDRHAALGRMVLVWNECQERESPTLSRAAIDNTNPDIPNFASLVIRAELAREINGGIYVAGAKERCGWLGKARRNGNLGGRPRNNQTVSKTKPSGSAENNPPAPAPAPTKEENSKEEIDPLEGAESIVGKSSGSDALADAFEAVWKVYPKTARGDEILAQQIFVEKVKPEDARTVVRAARRYAGQLENPKFAKGLPKWLLEWRNWIEPERPRVAVTPSSDPAFDAELDAMIARDYAAAGFDAKAGAR